MMAFFELLSGSLWLAMATVGILGLCVGSFLNVVIYRTPMIMHQQWRAESAQFWQNEPDLATTHKTALMQAVSHDTPITLSTPASTCPKCQHKIRFYENIPIVSWIFLGGKCSGCHNRISMRYPLVEIITALLSMLVIFVLGVSAAGFMALIFTWILVALTGIDFDTQLLPDRLVYPLGIIGILANTQSLYTTPVSAMFGATLGFLSLWSVATLYCLITKKEGMGQGDFKLLGAIGAWLGVGLLPQMIFVSSILGALIGGVLMIKNKGSKPFAFGPYIAIAGFIALLFGHQINAWYLGFYGG